MTSPVIAHPVRENDQHDRGKEREKEKPWPEPDHHEQQGKDMTSPRAMSPRHHEGRSPIPTEAKSPGHNDPIEAQTPLLGQDNTLPVAHPVPLDTRPRWFESSDLGTMDVLRIGEVVFKPSNDMKGYERVVITAINNTGTPSTVTVIPYNMDKKTAIPLTINTSQLKKCPDFVKQCPDGYLVEHTENLKALGITSAVIFVIGLVFLLVGIEDPVCGISLWVSLSSWRRPLPLAL